MEAPPGAADLIIVGQFGGTGEQSGVASGSQLFNMVTMVITGLTMGVTVFVGNAIGAREPEKAGHGVGTGIAMFGVIAAAHTYLQGYAIDCVFTAIFFCFVGYFNGCGKTIFVMVQGLVGAFCVRVPAVFLLSRLEDVSLFHIALATPLSSLVQIFLCLWAYRLYRRAPEKLR